MRESSFRLILRSVAREMPLVLKENRNRPVSPEKGPLILKENPVQDDGPVVVVPKKMLAPPVGRTTKTPRNELMTLTPRPEKERQDDDSSEDSDRDRQVPATLSKLPAQRKRKRGGRKHKKKVCRCGRDHRPRGHEVPRTIPGLSSKDCLKLVARKAIRSFYWRRKSMNKLQHILNGNGFSAELVVKVLVAASVVPLAWKAEEEAENLLESVQVLQSG
eukprot:s386_g39.t1